MVFADDKNKLELGADDFSFPTSLTFDEAGTAYIAESGLPFGGARPGAGVDVETGPVVDDRAGPHPPGEPGVGVRLRRHRHRRVAGEGAVVPDQRLSRSAGRRAPRANSEDR